MSIIRIFAIAAALFFTTAVMVTSDTGFANARTPTCPTCELRLDCRLAENPGS